MSLFKPTEDERETLKKAIAKFAHEPMRAHLLSCLDLPESEYDHDSEDWKKLKVCIEQHALHAETEVRRDPNKKSAKALLAKADALARKFHPNFS
jgi:hypothetical protein